MGNLCSNDSNIALNSTIQSDILTAWKKHTAHITQKSTDTTQSVQIPPLFDMCLDQLCYAIAHENNICITNKIIDNKSSRSDPAVSPHIKSTRKYSISDVESPILLPYGYTQQQQISPIHQSMQRRHSFVRPTLTETVLSIASNTFHLMSPHTQQRHNERRNAVPSLHMSSIHGIYPNTEIQNTRRSSAEDAQNRVQRTSSGDYSSSSSEDTESNNIMESSDSESDTVDINKKSELVQIQLPDIVLQMIFDRLVQHKWLNEYCCEQLSHVKLTHINLANYSNLSDKWLLLLLKSIKSNRQYSTSSAYSSPGRHTLNNTSEQFTRTITTPRAIFHNINNRTAAQNTTNALHAIDTPIADQFVNDLCQQYSLSSHYSTSTLDELVTSPLTVHINDTGDYLSPLLTSQAIQLTPSTVQLSTSTPTNITSPYTLNTPPYISNVHTPSIGDLSLNASNIHINTLTYFNISHCDTITDHALKSLQHCTQLQTLNLSHCTQVSDTLIASIVTNKQQLQYLNLGGCITVTNTVIDRLSDLYQLHTLILDSTQLTDHAVTGLHNLHRLTNLHKFSLAWCRNTTANGLYWLNNCSQLQYLNIAHTKIENCTVFAQCTKLKYLNISGIKLYEPHKQFTNVTYDLDTLIMSRCRIRDCIPPVVLHYNLQKLDLSFVHLSGTKLATALNYIANTKPMDVIEPMTRSRTYSEPVHNDMIHPVTPKRAISLVQPQNDELHTVPMLHTMNLESTNLDINGIRAISKLTNLTDLNISDTVIDNDCLVELHTLTNLTSLNLNGNKITNLTSIAELTQLQHLYIDCPAVTDAALTSLAKFTQLRTLDLFEAYVTDNCMQYLLPLKQLQKLQICSGKLSNISLTMISTALSELQELNVSHSKDINDHGIVALTCLKHLKHLNISGTSVTAAGLIACNEMSGLHSVSLFDSKIELNDVKSYDIRTGITIALNDSVYTVNE